MRKPLLFNVSEAINGLLLDFYFTDLVTLWCRFGILFQALSTTYTSNWADDVHPNFLNIVLFQYHVTFHVLSA